MNATNQRLRSIDALRGFDMIWLLGAETIFIGLYTIEANSVTAEFVRQFQHSQWHGITFYDLIFPLFIFLSGATLGLGNTSFMSLSVSYRREKYKRAVKRLFLLIVLGVLYNHGWGQGLPVDFSDIRIASVLMRIAVAWFCCAMIVWHCSEKSQITILFGILLCYWIIQQFVPTPDGNIGKLNGTESWNAWLDKHFLIGATYQNKVLDPEGIFSQIPAVANALAGAIFTRLLLRAVKGNKFNGVIRLFLLGSALVALACFWSMFLPLNKTLWTSSFSLLTIGLSCQLLCFFFWLFDVRKNVYFNHFFKVIGMNSILLYLLTSLFDWQYVVNSLTGQIVQNFSAGVAILLTTAGLIIIQWMFAHWLYKKGLFLKV